MNSVIGFREMLIQQWEIFQENMPVFFLAVVILVIGLFLINLIKKALRKILERRSDDSLATDFVSNIVALALSIVVVAVVMNILGWNSFTNKILAAAGLTTFVIGFALKDIGENFLAGIIMAFSRPFRLRDLIEINGFRGRVQRMSLRETTIKTLDGIDVSIPNGMILKNALSNYTRDRMYSGTIVLGLDYNSDLKKAKTIILEILQSNDSILPFPEPRVIVTDLATSSIDFSVRYWYSTLNVSAPGAELKSELIIEIYEKLKQEGFGFPADIVEVKLKKNV